MFTHLLNNISHDIFLISKASGILIDYINLIAIGSLLIYNVYNFNLYYKQYFYEHDIYVRSTIKFTLILNLIALVFVLITIYKTNSVYINKFLHKMYESILGKKKAETKPVLVPISTTSPESATNSK